MQIEESVSRLEAELRDKTQGILERIDALGERADQLQENMTKLMSAADEQRTQSVITQPRTVVAPTTTTTTTAAEAK